MPISKKKKKKPLERQDGDRFDTFFSLFWVMLLFVSIWNREDTKQTIKEKTEQNKTQNEDEIQLFERRGAPISVHIPMAIHSWGILPKYVSGMLVRSGLTANSFFMLRRTALRREGEDGGGGVSLTDERKWLACWFSLCVWKQNIRIWSSHVEKCYLTRNNKWIK